MSNFVFEIACQTCPYFYQPAFDLMFFYIFIFFVFLEEIYMWGPVVFEVLFRLNELGLWPNDPIRGRRHIRGQSTKVEVEIALQKELKVIYNRPKPI